PQNWWPSQQQPIERQPQLQPRPQSQQSQQPRRQPFPLRKPEVTVKEYPGCASTGNYRIANNSQESLNSNGTKENSCGSPHLLRPSKFWPQSQMHKLQPQQQQPTQQAQHFQQMHRQSSQPCLSSFTPNERY